MTELFKGGISSTVVDVKLIIAEALKVLASGIILVHNHPSGEVKPSSADYALTEKIKKACVLLDISLLDHLIITRNNYYSFADEGDL